MKRLSNKEAIKLSKSGDAVIIDVREPVEFLEGHLVNAINIPSTEFKVEDLELWTNKKVCLVCQSGNRASQMVEKIEKAYPEIQLFLLEDQMETIEFANESNKWSIDRQFRFTLGLFLTIFLIGSVFSSKFIIIPIILCVGLITTSIIDRCYLRLLITKMPWNNVQEEKILVKEYSN